MLVTTMLVIPWPELIPEHEIRNELLEDFKKAMEAAAAQMLWIFYFSEFLTYISQ